MDLSVLISFARGLPPIKILEPVHLRHFHMVKTAHIGNRLFEVRWFVFPEEEGQMPIHQTAFF